MSQPSRADRRAMQLALAGFLLWMGVRLALPDDLIATTKTMAGLAFQPEWAWTVECLIGGAIGVFSAWTSCRRCEFMATALMLSAHLSLSFFLIEGGAPLLPGALLMFVGLCAWTLARSWREVI